MKANKDRGKMQPLAPTRSRSRQNATSSHHRWTEDEDKLLLSLAKGTNPRWTEIATHFPNKTSHQVNDRWAKVLNPNLHKGSWTGEEDAAIVAWVNEHGPKDWSALAQNLKGRISKQCRERWHNHLSPNVSKGEWTEDEDKILIDAQEKWGNKWSKIATLLPGRTDNAVKNRWNSSLKKRLERMKNGQELTFKRGRKPKRVSEAPQEIPKPDFQGAEIKLTKEPTKEEEKKAEEDIPKPDLAIKETEPIFSPIKLDSALDTPVVGNKNWLMSPANGLLSPTLSWSPSQSPNLWGQLASPFGALQSPYQLQSPQNGEKGLIESIAPPKLD